MVKVKIRVETKSNDNGVSSLSTLFFVLSFAFYAVENRKKVSDVGFVYNMYQTTRYKKIKTRYKHDPKNPESVPN